MVVGSRQKHELIVAAGGRTRADIQPRKTVAAGQLLGSCCISGAWAAHSGSVIFHSHTLLVRWHDGTHAARNAACTHYAVGHHGCTPMSRATTAAALCPAAPTTEPAGCVPADAE